MRSCTHWSDASPFPPCADDSKPTTNADITVVGGGAVGACVALELAAGVRRSSSSNAVRSSPGAARRAMPASSAPVTCCRWRTPPRCATGSVGCCAPTARSTCAHGRACCRGWCASWPPRARPRVAPSRDPPRARDPQRRAPRGARRGGAGHRIPPSRAAEPLPQRARVHRARAELASRAGRRARGRRVTGRGRVTADRRRDPRSDEAHCDPRRFVQASARSPWRRASISGRASRYWLRAAARASTPCGRRPATCRCSEVVVAAGVSSPGLARHLGVRLPVESAKGYHVDVESRPGDPSSPVWLHESRVVITPLEGRLRLAGTLELTAPTTGRARRVEAIVAAARQAMPHSASAAPSTLARSAAVHPGRLAGHRTRSRIETRSWRPDMACGAFSSRRSPAASSPRSSPARAPITMCTRYVPIASGCGPPPGLNSLTRHAARRRGRHVITTCPMIRTVRGHVRSPSDRGCSSAMGRT